MRYLTLAEILELQRRVIEQSGGADGVRDLGGAESAVVLPQPRTRAWFFFGNPTVW
jgi:death-on-curing protein